MPTLQETLSIANEAIALEQAVDMLADMIIDHCDRGELDTSWLNMALRAKAQRALNARVFKGTVQGRLKKSTDAQILEEAERQRNNTRRSRYRKELLKKESQQ